MPLADRILLLLLGAIFGVVCTSWSQDRRERQKSLIEDVFRVVGDEISRARLNGKIDQENQISEWMNVDYISEMRIPNQIRAEFATYFQRASDLQDQKDILGSIRSSMFPQYSERTDIFAMSDKNLKLAANCEYVMDPDPHITYSVDFDDWILEYGEVVSDLLNQKKDPYQVSDETIERAIHDQEAEKDKINNMPKVWDEIVGQGNWGGILKGMFTFGSAGRYRRHLLLQQNAESDVKRSAQKLYNWMDVIISTNPLVPFLPRAKMILFHRE